jgi:hypothetical protein
LQVLDKATSPPSGATEHQITFSYKEKDLVILGSQHESPWSLCH